MNMKKILIFCLLFCLIGCSSENESDRNAPESESKNTAEDTAERLTARLAPPLEKPAATTELTLDNAPVMDGSDSTQPLRMLLMCRLLGIDCQWEMDGALTLTWRILPEWSKQSALSKFLKNNNTHLSFTSLIKGSCDITITARGISRDEQKEADENGVEVLSHPIARDAFIFIVNAANPVKSLTTEQVKSVYMGEITSWAEVGGRDAAIRPYVRNANSGSQEMMETEFMDGQTMPDWTQLRLWTMIDPYTTLAEDVDGICYTPFYYYDSIVRSERVSPVALDGITPSKTTIGNGTYPYPWEVMVNVRADIDKSSTAYQLFYQLATGMHDDIIEESGYIPLRRNEPSTGIHPPVR